MAAAAGALRATSSRSSDALWTKTGTGVDGAGPGGRGAARAGGELGSGLTLNLQHAPDTEGRARRESGDRLGDQESSEREM